MIIYNEETRLFHLSSRPFSYVLGVREGRLLTLYYGNPLPEETDLSYLAASYYSGSSFEQLEQNLPLELPSVGTGWYGDPAVQAIGPDGNNITKLRYADYKILPESMQKTLVQILEQDPRPSFHDDPERIYGMSYAGYEIHFQVKKGVLHILDISAGGQTPF